MSVSRETDVAISVFCLIKPPRLPYLLIAVANVYLFNSVRLTTKVAPR